MKASKYCTNFQIPEQRVSFQVIDTCDVTNYGGFYFPYRLLDKMDSTKKAY